MSLMTISSAAFDFSYFSPTLETFLFFLWKGIILIRLNLEFIFACSTFNANPFCFFVTEYSLSSEYVNKYFYF